MYRKPFGYSGVGSDIKWCGRWSGGKFCRYCGHYAGFEEWSNKWHWYYLVQWFGEWSDYYQNFSHFQVHQFYSEGFHRYRPYLQRVSANRRKNRPKRYKTTGIRETDLKSLLRKGCKKNRKCKCMSVAQRGVWYCPECYALMKRIAIHKSINFHDITLIDKNELKRDVLMLLLSGTM